MNGNTSVGGGGSVPGDALIVLLVLNEIRHRIVAAIFGVPREDSNRMTVIAAGTLAEGLHGGAARVLAAGALPPVAVAVVGAGALKETAHVIAGESSRTVPFFGGLIAFAVVGTSFSPLMRRSLRGARRSLHGAATAAHQVRAFVGGPAPTLPE